MKQIHLYIKTHQTTGKKYFGQTTKDPFVYRGSGKLWLEHLQEFGNAVSTEVLGTFDDRDLCKAVARKFSTDNDIVASDLWLNLIPETLGGTVHNGMKCRDTLYQRYGSDYFKSIAKIKHPEQAEITRAKLKQHPNCAAGGKQNLGRVRTKSVCPHCGTIGAKNTLVRWHFDNCKMKGVPNC